MRLFIDYIIGVVIIMLFGLVFIGGEINKQNEIEQRALQLEQKDCYDWQDIEIIIFGEIQE